jgi:hypothetical protein
VAYNGTQLFLPLVEGRIGSHHASNEPVFYETTVDGVEAIGETQRADRVGTRAPHRRWVFGEGGVNVSAKRAEFADFLQKRLTEGGLTDAEVAAAALIARVRGWNRYKRSKPKTRRKTQLKVGDDIEQNGAKFTIEEVRFGKVVAVKDADGVIHRKEQS